MSCTCTRFAWIMVEEYPRRDRWCCLLLWVALSGAHYSSVIMLRLRNDRAKVIGVFMTFREVSFLIFFLMRGSGMNSWCLTCFLDSCTLASLCMYDRTFSYASKEKDFDHSDVSWKHHLQSSSRAKCFRVLLIVFLNMGLSVVHGTYLEK